MLVWEAITGRLIHKLDLGLKEWSTTNSVAWSPDGKYLALGAGETTQVWDVTIGRLIAKYSIHAYAIISVIWSNKDIYITSDTKSQQIELNKVVDGNVISSYIIYSGGKYTSSIGAVTWSPNRKYLAIAFGYDYPGIIRVWESSSGKHVVDYNIGNNAIVLSIAWSPDGRYIAWGAFGLEAGAGTILGVSEVVTGKAIRTFSPEFVPSEFIDWSPDGKYIVSGISRVGPTAQVGDFATGKVIADYTFYTGPLNLYISEIKLGAWSPDGKYIAWVVSGNKIEICWAV
ncbi:hypothetical protein KSF_105510 [Reticulibacter mediterranei]|uniref:Translation initiation factor beta propellor-like domain-containing protein n=1 Tax=Reticulibacter mediterranei TaxID=2778369 RepID=A0A8J3ITX4_9CHLR|nr:hypothetical protein KSF_105510 [Reticulibacter mediterranei]